MHKTGSVLLTLFAFFLAWEGHNLTRAQEIDDQEKERRRELAEAQAKHGLDSLKTGEKWASLGTYLLFESNDLNGAELALTQSIEIFRKHKAQEKAVYGEVLPRLALIKRFLGKHGDSLPLLEESFAWHQQQNGEDSPEAALAAQRLGDALVAVKKYAAAIKPLMLAEKFLAKKSPKSPSYFLTTFALTEAHSGLSNKEATITYAEKTLQAARDVFGEETSRFSRNLKDVAVALRNVSALKESLQFIRIAKDSCQQTTEPRLFADCVYDEVVTLQLLQENQAAYDLLVRCDSLLQESYGEASQRYAAMLNALGQSALATHRNQEAIRYWSRLAKLRQNKLREFPSYAVVLINLSSAYAQSGATEKALQTQEKAVAVQKQVYGENAQPLVPTLTQLALISLQLEDNAKAIAAIDEAVRIARKPAIDKKLLLKALCQAGHVYWANANLGDAQSHYDEALELCDQVTGSEQQRFECTMGLVQVLVGLNDLVLANQIASQLQQQLKDARQENSLQYAETLGALASLAERRDDFSRYQELKRQALAIYQSQAGPESVTYVSELLKYVTVCMKFRAFEEMNERCKEALPLAVRVFGKQHPHYVTFLVRRGTAERELGKLSSANQTLNEARTILRNSRQERSYNFIQTLHQLALISRSLGKNSVAIEQYEQVVKRNKEIYGPRHFTSISSLAILGNLMRDETGLDPLPTLAQVCELQRQELQSKFPALSERQQLSLLKSTRRSVNNFLTVALENISSPDFNGDVVYQHVLPWKGVVSSAQRQAHAIHQSGSATELLTQWQGVTSRLAAVYNTDAFRHGNERTIQRVRELIRKRDRLEAELARLTTQQPKLSPAELLEKLKSRLPEGAVFIDFWEFLHGPEDTPAIIVFVIRPNTPVKMISLGNKQSVAATIEQWRALATGRTAEGDLSQTAKKLRALLWEPLANFVLDSTVVLYSPDGCLSRFPLGTLPADQPGHYLIEKYAFATIPVPRLWALSLDIPSSPQNGSQGLVLIGDVDYGKQPDRPTKKPFIAFQPLDGADQELKLLQDLWHSQHPQKPLHVLTRQRASELKLREVLHSGRFIHLSTHGFFDPEGWLPEGESLDEVLSPEAFSGIALARANLATTETAWSHSTHEDGILSALEISTLNWSGAELVMLSACESALGQESLGEGMLGLQRAFQIGGSKSVVATLWPVEQQATIQLTKSFYQNLWEKQLPKVEALRQAQIAVLNRKIAASEPKGAVVTPLPTGTKLARSHPAFWAGWVLSGDPGDLDHLLSSIASRPNKAVASPAQGSSASRPVEFEEKKDGSRRPSLRWTLMSVIAIVIVGGMLWYRKKTLIPPES